MEEDTEDAEAAAMAAMFGFAGFGTTKVRSSSRYTECMLIGILR